MMFLSTRLTPALRGRMLSSMRIGTPGLRIALALLATVAVMVAPTLHAAHSHDDAANTVHAPCAVCQMHAPAGTPPDVRVAFVEPDPVLQFVDVHRDALHPDPHCRVDACRAPPHLLAA